MIDVQDLSYSYAGTVALRGASLQVQPGEHLAVVGANGSGKTTLARCLNGLLIPDAGTVVVDGLSSADSESHHDLRRLVGMVFQNPDDQLVATTVEAEIAFGMENLGLPQADMVHRVDDLLSAFHLQKYRRHPPHQLSGGEKQRVAVAACVALQPRYLVLDEPTSLLDPRARTELADLLAQLRRDLGIATLHITQIPDEAARADRIVVLHRGEIAVEGPADEVFTRGEELHRMGLAVPFAHAVSACLPSSHRPPRDAVDLQTLAAAVAGRFAAANRTPGDTAAAQERRGLASESPASGTGPAPSPHPPVLETRGLTHVYDAGLPSRQSALGGVDVSVWPARALALVGPSGSGKTTLAQHLNGLLRPATGTVHLAGSDVWETGPPGIELRRRVGLIFQFPELQLFEETVAADVAFGPKNLGCDDAEIAARVGRALALVGLPLSDFGPRSPLALSGGERRRVAIAGVLAMDPDVLVLDEPTAGLDPAGAAMLADLLRHLRSQGRALVLISHDMDLVADLADDVVVLAGGEVALSGETRQVLCHPDFASRSGLELPSAVLFSQLLTERGATPDRCLLTLDETRQFVAGLPNEKDLDDDVR